MNKILKRIFNPDDNAGFLPSLIAIIIGLIAGFLVLLVSKPSQAVPGFLTIIGGGTENLRSFGQVLYYATPILMTGLSFSFASKTGLFNIGASGQFISGGFVAILIGVKCTFLPGHLHWIAAILGALLAGAAWGAVPGILKALFNVNEVISCIMMNYIGMYLVNYLIGQTILDSRYNQTLRVAQTAIIPRMGLDKIFKAGTNPSVVDGGILIAILLAVVLYIILEKTAFGYELKACGLNRNAAKYAGINEKRSIILSMTIAGAAAGIGGALMYLSISGNRIDVADVLAPAGFNGIPVALLAMSNPIGVIFSAVFIGYLNYGGFVMQRYDFAPQIIEIIVSIIIYFSAFALVTRNIISSIGKRKRAEADGKGGGEL